MQLYKFNKNVTARYESHIEDGMYFLFNVATGDYWTGNTSSYVLLNNFKNKILVKEAVQLSADNFDTNSSELEKTLENLVTDLANKGFLNSYEE